MLPTPMCARKEWQKEKYLWFASAAAQHCNATFARSATPAMQVDGLNVLPPLFTLTSTAAVQATSTSATPAMQVDGLNALPPTFMLTSTAAVREPCFQATSTSAMPAMQVDGLNALPPPFTLASTSTAAVLPSNLYICHACHAGGWPERVATPIHAGLHCGPCGSPGGVRGIPPGQPKRPLPKDVQRLEVKRAELS